MAVASRILPGDALFISYNLLLSTVWAGFGSGYAPSPWYAAGHLLAAALPLAIVRERHPARGAAAALRETYPLVFLAAYWPEMDKLREILGTHGHEESILQADHFLFGQHLHDSWPRTVDAFWFSELMHFAYFAYYFLILGPPLWLALTGRRAAVRDVVLRMMATYLSCYLIYMVFPVYGPRFTWDPIAGPRADGFFYRAVDAALAAGDSRGCAFPSSHVAGSVTIAWIGWRWFPRPIAMLLSLEALGVVTATVYTRNHYAIDSVAGIIWAVLVQWVCVPVAVGGWIARTRRRQLPPLPIFSPRTNSAAEAAHD